ncbi:MAG TPA: hypothetical protein ENN30_02340 [Candidatus Woesearchaeota archaeon]|mgnify:CR=1 FL=1|nr:hypothetical protein [Candidatus Woesearchaeota archaeon]
MRAQAISNDILFAAMIIILIIGALGIIIFEFENFESQREQNRDMMIKSENAMNSLLQTPGNPENWESLTNTSYCEV